MGMSLLAIMALAGQCAPTVAPETLASVVSVESSFDPLVIGINGRRHLQLHPVSKAEAVAMAQRLIAHGANIDLGLGQINARNLASLGLSVADAFDPCRNLAASAEVIEAGYVRAGPQPGAEQAALRTSLSLYNTGSPWRGFANGYVAKVTAAANQIVPSLRPDAPNGAAAIRVAPTPPAAWDVFAEAAAPAAGWVFTPTSGDGR
jgi:type IV secretion system protein VirB1